MTSRRILRQLLLLLIIISYYNLLVNADGRTNTISYSYSGASQYFTVPYNVFSINVTLYGAAGGYDYCNSGFYGGLPGYGGSVEAKLTVTPLSTLCVTVGVIYVLIKRYYINSNNNHCLIP